MAFKILSFFWIETEVNELEKGLSYVFLAALIKCYLSIKYISQYLISFVSVLLCFFNYIDSGIVLSNFTSEG